MEERQNQIKLYAISGLGADQRVYNYLNISVKLIHLNWISPLKNESIADYAKRLAEDIDTSQPFGLIGMSFGGIVAVEITKQLNPKFTILISSAETKYELRTIYRWFGKLNIIRFFPEWCFNMPRWIAYYIFGAQNKALLKAILDDADMYFTKWAVNQISRWKNETKIKNCYKIGGTKDKLIPQKMENNMTLIENGEHFMIVDMNDSVSEIINNQLINLN